jgi:hypothetical protein
MGFISIIHKWLSNFKKTMDLWSIVFVKQGKTDYK